jgi:hypothetical protein
LCTLLPAVSPTLKPNGIDQPLAISFGFRLLLHRDASHSGLFDGHHDNLQRCISQQNSRSRSDLAGPTTWTLASDDGAEDDQLATPHPVGLAAVKGTGKALVPQWATSAHGFCGLNLVRQLREEKVGVVCPAGQVDALVFDPGNDGLVEHRWSPPQIGDFSDSAPVLGGLVSSSGTTKRPRIPVEGFAASKCQLQ